MKERAAPQPKAWILDIQPYVPGKAAASGTGVPVKLSANENPLGMGALAQKALAEAAARTDGRYPDPDSRELREAIALAHGLEVDRIVCGTGSDELLNLAAQAFAGPGDEIVYVRYGFSVYDIAARRVGATPVVADDSDYGTDIDAVLAAIGPKTRLVFLANPNNPTGSFCDRAEIARLHDAMPGEALLVLDQAYAEYLDEADDDGGLDLARQSDNVLVTRTFSKIHGLAGERIGWAYGAPGLVAALNRIRGPFNVTRGGQAAATQAITDRDFVARSREHNATWRDWLAKEIAALGNHGLRALPSKGNFLLVLFEGEVTAQMAYEHLMSRGYIVRWLPGQGLGHGLRITIGLESDMCGLVAALREWLEARA